VWSQMATFKTAGVSESEGAAAVTPAKPVPERRR